VGNRQESGVEYVWLAQNGFGIRGTWVDLTWVDSLDQNVAFTGIRQDWGQPHSQSGVWALQ
jgi:hypothetical protein